MSIMNMNTCIILLVILASGNADSEVEYPSQYFLNASEIIDWLQEYNTPINDRVYVTILLLDEFSLTLGNPNIIPFIENQLTETDFESIFNDFKRLQYFIDDYHKRMDIYIINPNTFIQNSSARDFCKTLISNNFASVANITININKLLLEANKDNVSLIGKISRILEVRHPDFHRLMLSPSQVLIWLYKSVILSHLKGYCLIQFAYQSLGDEMSAKQYIETFKENVKSVQKEFKTYIKASSTTIRRVTVNINEEHTAYESIKGLALATPLFVQHLTSDGKCYKNCEDIKTLTKVKCHDDKFCKNQQCRKATECQTIERPAIICYAENDGWRKYSYITNKKSTWGESTSYCSHEEIIDRSFFSMCSFCMCTCVESGNLHLPPEIYINLRGVTANLADNRVVTGVRFVKHNDIIHIQIQEGKLLAFGNIDKDSVQWVPVENYTVMDRNITRGQDYHKLTWNSRAFYLDDLKAQDGFAVIGVRMRVIKGHIKLDIQVTKIDYKTGRLINPQETSYKSNMQSPTSLRHPRTQVKLFEPEVPVFDDLSAVTSSPNQYIKFTISDLKKDVGQTIVPYFDCQPVNSSIPSILQGLGVFHKAKPGNGGFIALKIMTYEVDKFL